METITVKTPILEIIFRDVNITKFIQFYMQIVSY